MEAKVETRVMEEAQIQWSAAQHPEWTEKKFQQLENLQVKCLIFYEDLILVETLQKNPVSSLQFLSEEIWQASNKYHLGAINQQAIYAIEIPKLLKETQGHTFISLKIFLESQPEYLQKLICRAKQLLNWQKLSLFCSACGGKTQHSEKETAKVCENCKRIIYPNTAPAVLVLIARGDEILLARSSYFRPGVYSVLAGFVEAGESAEDTIRREVHEEVGISVKNIRYFGSQAWPFENSFMLAYRSDYQAGDIIINPDEIEDAKWFKIDALPGLPYKSSLSRTLIDTYVQEKNKL